MNRRRSLIAIASAVVFAALLLGVRPAMATPEEDIGRFISDLADKAIAELTPTDISDYERAERMRHLLRDNFDTPAIGRFVLGLYWRKASEAERERFMALYEEVVIRNYAALFRQYSSEKIEVTGVRPFDDSHREYIVSSQIIRPAGPAVDIEWRVVNQSAARIIDVKIEGVSMPITHRNEYSSLIRRNGGNISSLLDTLGKKISKPLSKTVSPPPAK